MIPMFSGVFRAGQESGKKLRTTRDVSHVPSLRWPRCRHKFTGEGDAWKEHQPPVKPTDFGRRQGRASPGFAKGGADVSLSKNRRGKTCCPYARQCRRSRQEIAHGVAVD